jgi:hypothetical protein
MMFLPRKEWAPRPALRLGIAVRELWQVALEMQCEKGSDLPQKISDFF